MLNGKYSFLGLDYIALWAASLELLHHDVSLIQFVVPSFHVKSLHVLSNVTFKKKHGQSLGDKINSFGCKVTPNSLQLQGGFSGRIFLSHKFQELTEKHRWQLNGRHCEWKTRTGLMLWPFHGRPERSGAVLMWIMCQYIHVIQMHIVFTYCSYIYI